MASRANLPRRVAGRARRELARLRRVTVRAGGAGEVRVSRLRGPGWLHFRLADEPARYAVRGGTLRLLLPDPAALIRLAASGLLVGQVRRLRVRLADAPEWLVTAVRPPRLGRTAVGVGWRRRGRRLTVTLRWSKPYGVDRALADAIAAVVRARPWDQASGPVPALDRTAWLHGGASWPQGHLVTRPPDVPPDPLGRPLGPYQLSEPPPAPLPPPLITTVANPFGRRLVGTAAAYRLFQEPGRLSLRDESGRVVLRLDRGIGPEGTVAGGGFAKYAVATVDSTPGPDAAAGLRALAACGVVFAAPDLAVRAELDRLGVVAVAHAKEVDDLRGYALSVAASRRATIDGDAALRRTELAAAGAGSGALPLPGVSVVLSSMRAEHIDVSLGYLAGQTYPALEVLVGLHGYEVDGATRDRWAGLLRCPLRVVPFPAELPFGAVLGRLTRMADGELVTKLDDDDHYGRHHVTDLLLAWHTSGADVVAKGARFVHFPELAQTIDRAWAAPELFNVTPAGGTILASRGALAQVGGWSHSSKHVDEDLLIRVRSAGGLVYRTHALEYSYVRRTTGHTFVTRIDDLAEQGERVYPGLPREIIDPDPVRPTT
ncbi:MAG: hypothetical protein GEV12_13375 [Micromonosporaceae bacterium]|nr:hypothetical protein [Micromonosporaceae bacterium]